MNPITNLAPDMLAALKAQEAADQATQNALYHAKDADERGYGADPDGIKEVAKSFLEAEELQAKAIELRKDVLKKVNL